VPDDERDSVLVPAAQANGVTRRTVLKIGAAGAAGTIAAEVIGIDPVSALLTLPNPPNTSLDVELWRRDDMMALRFGFVNVRLDTTVNPAVLRIKNVNKAVRAIVTFRPQAVGEQVFPIPPDPPAPVPYGGVSVSLANESRLAFDLPANLFPMPFTTAQLLDWTAWVPRLTPVVEPPNGVFPKLVQPDPHDTAIEVPWRLFLSPTHDGRWVHQASPVAHDGRVELWHTRLGVDDGQGNVVEPPVAVPAVQAVWTTKMKGKYPNLTAPANPFPMSLTDTDRVQLVRLMSDWNSQAGGPQGSFTPAPARADFFALSSLGAFLDGGGSWDSPLPLESWRHRGTQGREHYVRVVYKGMLHPLGIPASLIKITERMFVQQGGSWEATLYQREFIVVRNPVKHYDSPDTPNPFQPDGGRAFPFRTVRLTTTTTPNIDTDISLPAREYLALAPPNDKQAFWVNIGGTPFRFDVVGTDWEGRDVSFQMAMVFVYGTSPQSVAFDPVLSSALAVQYDAAPVDRRTVPMGGQKVALAETTVPGDTTAQLTSFEFGIQLPAGTPTPQQLFGADQAAFFPLLKSAAARLPGLDQLQGALPVPPDAIIKLGENFIKNGFPDIGVDQLNHLANPAEVFAEVDKIAMGNTLPGIDLPKDLAGGVAIPNLGVAAFSRQLGPVGDAVDSLRQLPGSYSQIQDLVNNPSKFDPLKYFDALKAKILGAISLGEILQLVGFNPNDVQQDANKVKDALDKLPKFPAEVIYPNGDKTQIPEAVRVTLQLKPKVQSSPGNFFQVIDEDDKKTSMLLKAVIYTPIKDPAGTTYDVLGEINNFKMNLFGDGDLNFFILVFDKARFTAKSKSKPAVDIQISDVQFGKCLKFVEQLQKFFESLGQQYGIEVTREGVRAKFDLAIPQLAVGVFTMMNISFGFDFRLPFDTGKARLKGYFCTREHPFLLTVSCFGGGGYFGVALGLDGVELIEASLNAAANLALDIGVASGELHVMAGIYFKLEKKTINNVLTDTIELTGFVQAGGSLHVLGIVHISIEIYVGLTFVTPPQKAYGKASVKLKVEILFFSFTISAEVKIQIGSSDQDPPFTDFVPNQLTWDTYCDAFAT
jgi:hypothetical protein